MTFIQNYEVSINNNKIVYNWMRSVPVLHSTKINIAEVEMRLGTTVQPSLHIHYRYVAFVAEITDVKLFQSGHWPECLLVG